MANISERQRLNRLAAMPDFVEGIDAHIATEIRELGQMLVAFLNTCGISIKSARSYYESIDATDLQAFEVNASQLIASVLERPHSQRRACFDQGTQGATVETRLVLHVLVVLSAMRAQALLAVRSRILNEANPDRGFRAATAAAFQIAQSLHPAMHYQWPSSLIDALAPPAPAKRKRAQKAAKQPRPAAAARSASPAKPRTKRAPPRAKH